MIDILVYVFAAIGFVATLIVIAIYIVARAFFPPADDYEARAYPLKTYSESLPEHDPETIGDVSRAPWQKEPM